MAKQQKSTVLNEGYKHISCDPQEAKEIAKTALKAGCTTMFWGAPGQGKTAICRQIQKEIKGEDGKPYYDSVVVFNPSQMDTIDAKLPYIDKGEVSYAVSSMIPKKGRHLVVIDEINTAPPGTAAMWFSLTLEKRIGNFYLPEGCGVVATGNRETDRSAAQPMALAQKDRMIHVNVTPSTDAFCDWAMENGIRDEIISYVRSFPQALEGNNPDDPTGGCSPRSLEMLSRNLDVGCPQKTEMRMIYGTIGQANGIEFSAFVRLFRDEISFEELIDNPETYMVPKEMSKLYAIITGLGTRVDEKNFKNISKYIARLDPTYQAIFIMDSIKRYPKLAMRQEFRKFCKTNHEIVLS